MNPNSTEAELESFRQKWREEVSARAKGKQPAKAIPASTKTAAASSSSSTKHPKPNAPEPSSHARQKSEEIDEIQPHFHHVLGEKHHGRRLDGSEAPSSSTSKEPQSALEHYEKAVERETQGSLGDSLNLYRKAFKLDDKVHETYKAKHFPPSYFKRHPPIPSTSKFHPPSTSTSNPSALNTASVPSIPHPSNASPTVPNTAHHSLTGLPPTLQSLLSSFSNLSIQGEEPPTEFSPPPPCPISTIPEEILVEILTHLAMKDLASFARLSQVCKRLAYLVNTEDRIWKRIALDHEYGFAVMHYDFACQIDGKPLPDDPDDDGYILGSSSSPSSLDFGTSSTITPKPQPLTQEQITASLIPTPYPTYHTLFRLRPRIRFNGLYISTVNYTRPGSASVTQITWNVPIHIVTYYRYLRFLRNGTCISLLTTAEPADVVPYMYVEHVHRNHGNLPSAPMKDAVLGRWRITRNEEGQGKDGGAEAADGHEAPEMEKEGTVIVEKAGVTAKYLDKMVLRMGSAGRGARNNKLSWAGYWSYNRLTDDWAEFGLKNDRAFYWSRVKSYGMGFDDE